MDAKKIESRLRPHIANVALAAVGKREGDLREAKDALLREVERIVFDAAAPSSHGTDPTWPDRPGRDYRD